MERPFSINKITKKLQKAENSSPGPDRLTYHHWRSVPQGHKFLTAAFNACLLFPKVPPSWKRTTTVLIPKTKDKLNDPSNWRPIALSNTLYKIYTKVLAGRLQEWTAKYGALSPCQKGFTPFDGVLEHNFVLQTRLEHARLRKKNICIAWLDVSNAFGALPHQQIYKALAAGGTGEKFLNIIQDLYTDCATKILSCNTATNSIPLKSGVKQGCPISGLLFNLGIDHILRRIQGTASSHRILAFADDLCLLGDSPEDLQDMLDVVLNEMTKIGLLLNPSKSFSFHFSGSTPVSVPPSSFRLGSETIQSILEFQFTKFLGKPVGFNPVPDYTTFNTFGDCAKKLLASLLSPWQKLDALKCFLFPALQFVMRTGQFKKEDWSLLDDAIRHAVKEVLFLPEHAANDYIYGHTKSGCVGLPISAEESDLNRVDSAFKLLTSSDDMISDLALQNLRCSVSARVRRDASDEDLSDFMSGSLAIDDDRPPSNPLANIWTVARVASRRQKIEWMFTEGMPQLKFQDLVLKTCTRRKILFTIRNRLRQDRALALTSKPDQGKAMECVPQSPISSHFIANGFYTRFSEYRFIHRARLNLLPDLDFIAIQDPYLIKGEPLKPNFGCKVFMSKGKRAITYVLNKSLNCYFKFNTMNSVTVELHFNNIIFNVFNCYFPPHDDIEQTISELQDYNFCNSFNLVVGDFNCKSRSWGYDSDNFKGRKLSEFIAASNLHICNISEYGPTFQSTIHVGFPDLTLLSIPIINYMKNWGVLDMESHSDHKYIYFNLELEDIPEADFFLKSKYGINKFSRYVKKNLGYFKNKLAKSSNIIYLNNLFLELTDFIKKAAFKTLKKKPKKFAKYSFWNEDLRLARNKVSMLFKIYNRHKLSASSDDMVQSSGLAYRKARAEYKRLLLSTKRKAWEIFCTNYNERFNFLFKLVFNKGGSQDSIRVNPNDNPNNTIRDKITYIMDNFFPGRTSEDDLNYIPVIGSIDPILIEDLELVFKGLKGGKAPGLDRIDYRMWGAAELAAIQFAANWAVSENSKINSYTDSLSSILALQSASSRSNFVNKAKTDLFKAKNLVGLSWVKAHVGIQGNELADQQAKLATTTDIVLKLDNKIYIIDVVCPFENRLEGFERAKQEKMRKYTVLIEHLLPQASAVEIVPIVVGALGAWDPANDKFLLKIMSKSYLKTFSKLCVSDNIRWARDIYVEHITSVRQFDESAIVNNPNFRPREMQSQDDPLAVPINCLRPVVLQHVSSGGPQQFC
ncbi:Retrovirus-related Pol polyprotein from type-2 retrotransposable element R2DM [Araneus ventricosus]|uniref:Retrovirus-related Pol polyprotein from type-2 retrotransposable element R2DM n=1 Tax=Araneus ventricosus TaxID=182803 RepID=A0A4Y2RRT3_ARAVE|nr:Retrovirus-related Pol polyprotein from type-2 retrotransposable element R2DM [Araneus ventricosus]